MTRLHAFMLGGLVALGAAWGALTARRHRRASQIAQHQLAALTDAVRSLSHAAALDDFLADVIRAIAEQLGARWVLLFLHDPTQDTLAVNLVFKDGRIIPREHATPNLVHPLPARDVPLWDELERTRRPVHVADIRTDPRLRQRDALLAQGVHSMLLVPLLVGDSLIGWFSVRTTSPRDYRPDELELAAALAQQAALAVQLTRLGVQDRQGRCWRSATAWRARSTTRWPRGSPASSCSWKRPSRRWRPGGRTSSTSGWKARALARASLTEARRSVWALRPQALEQQPLVAALRAAATTLTMSSGVQLAFAVDGTVGYVPTELETDLLRVAQEAITNSVKHAAARTLQVRVRDDGQHLTLQIRDDGRGFAPQTPRPGDGSGFGLTAMRERMERHGGRLIIQSAPGQGTEIIARVDRLLRHSPSD